MSGTNLLQQTTGAPAEVRAACAMSGERETLTVKLAGLYGVHFVYGDDASVIVAGDDLRQVRAIIDHQIRRQERANAR